MPQYLYRLHVTRPDILSGGATDDENAIISAHFARLQALTEQGVVILAGRTLSTDADSFGIVIFNAPDQAAAQAIMASDPAVEGGVMRAKLFPYRIALISEANVTG